jgi:cell fate (sporulation/competence/biofilm development) regulator YlbF (YheA/YmcA/DUF963 family)
MKDFDTYNRFRDSFRAKAGDGDTPKESSPNVALLKKVQRLVFGPNVTDLAEAKTRLASLIDSLDDDEQETKKKTVKPVE